MSITRIPALLLFGPTSTNFDDLSYWNNLSKTRITEVKKDTRDDNAIVVSNYQTCEVEIGRLYSIRLENDTPLLLCDYKPVNDAKTAWEGLRTKTGYLFCAAIVGFVGSLGGRFLLNSARLSNSTMAIGAVGSVILGLVAKFRSAQMEGLWENESSNRETTEMIEKFRTNVLEVGLEGYRYEKENQLYYDGLKSRAADFFTLREKEYLVKGYVEKKCLSIPDLARDYGFWFEDMIKTSLEANCSFDRFNTMSDIFTRQLQGVAYRIESSQKKTDALQPFKQQCEEKFLKDDAVDFEGILNYFDAPRLDAPGERYSAPQKDFEVFAYAPTLRAQIKNNLQTFVREGAHGGQRFTLPEITAIFKTEFEKVKDPVAKQLLLDSIKKD